MGGFRIKRHLKLHIWADFLANRLLLWRVFPNFAVFRGAQHYARILAADLSRQQWDGCFERNVLQVLEQCYGDTLLEIHRLSFDASSSPVNKGLSNLTQQVLGLFAGFSDAFLQCVVDKHRTSCALSNFPAEHKPDMAYVNAVKQAIAERWQHFAIQVNSHFLDLR